MQDKSANQADNQKPKADIFALAVKGGVWILMLRLLITLLVFAKLVVIARFLGPGLVGLLGVSMLVLAILNTFTQVGFTTALIQKKEDIKTYLDTAWSLGIIRAGLIIIILYFLAPYAAIFFEEPRVVNIIRVISLTVLLDALNNIGVMYFRKEMDFKKHFFFRSSATLADTIMTISFAVVYRNVWALVAGRLTASCVKLATSYLIHPYRPRFIMDTKKAGELWGFGKHILGSSILRFCILQGDDIVLARMLGKEMLGLYRYAYRISNMIATEISDMIAQVAFSAFSKLQDNKQKLRAGYFKTIQVVSLIVFPIAGGIIILSYEFIHVVLGDQWLPMEKAMQILCVLGLLKCFQRAPAFKAVGRPDVITKLSIIRFAVLAVTIYPMTKKYGMEGTSLSVLVSCLSSQPFAFGYLQKLIGAKFTDVAKVLSFPIAATLITMLCIFTVKNTFDTVGVLSLVFLAALGAAVYLAVICLVGRIYKDYNVFTLIRDIAKGLK
ncbi:MAG: lipopolysaccharide biosynthesis protein [Planctomycetota bacterium]|jgi:O-antigen/teichoic acid export membrane protein